MIRRAFWLAAGVTIGVIAVRKVSQAKSTLGPEGLNRAVGQISDSITDFADALRSAMTEREDDLRAALGVEAPTTTTTTTTTGADAASGAVSASRRARR